MRLDTSKLIKKPELADEDINYHKNNRFYSPEMLDKPEFCYKNHLIELKDADTELLEQALANEEAEESKRALLMSQDGTTSQNTLKKDTKAKETKGKGGGKGAQAEADKNAPKPIEIEYPEIDSEKDYVLVEKSFN